MYKMFSSDTWIFQLRSSQHLHSNQICPHWVAQGNYIQEDKFYVPYNINYTTEEIPLMFPWKP